MTCPVCGAAMSAFPICDWPEGYTPKHPGERAARVTAVIYHCGGPEGCGHQLERTRS